MSADAQPISIRYVIFCDDIRIEINGKSIFVGVYTDDIAIPAFPGFLNLSFWLDVWGHSGGKHDLAVTVSTSPEEVGVFQFKTKVDVPHGEARTSIAFGGVVLKMDQPGSIIIKYSVDDGDWIEAARKSVVKSAPLAPVVPAT